MRWKNVVIPLLAVLLVGLLVVQPASAAETDDGGLIGAVSDYLFGWLSDNSVSEAPVPTDPPYVPGLIDQNLTLQGEVLDGYDYYQTIEYAACDQEIYQQDIVIHRSSGTAYNETIGGLEVWHIYVGDHCREDYGDIRFVNSTGAELAYYLWPDYDSSSARVCVRLEGADAAGTLTVHYGNPTATTTSDGDATYIQLFDPRSCPSAEYSTGFAYVSDSGKNVNAKQGVATDGSYIYTADATSLQKYDMSWNLQGTADLTEHMSFDYRTGDLCHYDGNLYIATHCNTASGTGEILVYAASDLSYGSTLALSSPPVGAYNAGAITIHDGYAWILWECLTKASDVYIDQYAISPSWSMNTRHTITNSINGWKLQGIVFVGDYLYAPIHEGSSPAGVEVYLWTGSGFSFVDRLSPPTSRCTQGIDWDGEHFWFAERSHGGTEGNNWVVKAAWVEDYHVDTDAWTKVGATLTLSSETVLGRPALKLDRGTTTGGNAFIYQVATLPENYSVRAQVLVTDTSNNPAIGVCVAIDPTDPHGYTSHLEGQSSFTTLIVERIYGADGFDEARFVSKEVVLPKNVWYTYVVSAAGTTYTTEIYDNAGDLLYSQSWEDATYSRQYAGMRIWRTTGYISEYEVRAYSATPPAATAFLTGPAPEIPPVAGFSGSPTSGTAPLTVQFTDTSTGNVTGWSWTFGDGNTSTEQSPVHTYESSGTYTVNLTASNAYGNDTLSQPAYITVAAPVAAGDLPTIYYTACDQPVYQQDLVLHRSAGTSYEETIGGLNVWHIYVGDHCREDYGDIRFVNSTGAELAYYLWPDYDSSSARFAVRLEGATTAGTLTVHYGNPTATTTSDGDATYIQLFDPRSCPPADWTKVGATLTLSSETVLGRPALKLDRGTTTGRSAFIYQVATLPENYSVRAQVLVTDTSNNPAIGVCVAIDPTDPHGYTSHLEGQSSFTTLIVERIYGATGFDEPRLVSKEVVLPKNVWYTYVVSAAGTTYTTEIYDNAGNLLYSQSWEDAKYSRQYAGMRIWRTTGYISEYEVRAYSATPPAATAFLTVPAPEIPPVAGFSGSPTSGTAPLTVQFTDTSTGSPTSWAWTFGDGGTSSEQNPQHTYESSGTYTVNLTASNAYGNDTLSQPAYITVAGVVAANFTANVTSGVAPLAVQFTDGSTGTPAAWNWTFGDGAFSEEQSPSHTYVAAGVYTVTLNASNQYSYNISSQTDYVTVLAAPAAAFTTNASAGNAPLTVAFTDTSTGNVTTWAWDFGDGEISTDRNATHTYTGPGSYNVTLNASNVYISNISAATAISVLAPPVASFTANATVIPTGSAVAFTDASTGNVTAWAWAFCDGNTSTDRNVTHTYATPGTYTVTLNASNPYGYNLSTRTDYIGVGNPPATDFTANVTAGLAPLAVQFTDGSTDTPTSWSWTFGDGNSSTDQNATHLYEVPGTYTVNLTTSNAYGNDTLSQPAYITVAGVVAANFTANVTSGVAPLAVQFTDGSTGTPTSWNWTFGDGETSTDQSPSHIYAVAGTYTVTLNASHAYGYNVSTQTDLIVVGDAVAANFTANVTSGAIPLAVQFTDASTGSPTSWNWTFGDGNSSTDQNATHIYEVPGTYTVTLNASNQYSYNISTQTGLIMGFAPPVVAFSANATVIPVGGAVQFTDASTGGLLDWRWSFGDGNTSTDQNPVHTYAAPGLYNVTLNASNPYGFSISTQTDYIDVGNPPVAGFSANATVIPVGGTIQFTDDSTGDITGWAWDFGDGNTSTDRNATHTYSTAGLQTVNLTVSNAYGEDTETKVSFIDVGLPPVADFTPSATIGVVPAVITFTDTSANTPTAWLWDFGDGNNSTHQIPSHTYVTAGTYTVTLTATNAYGGGSEAKTDLLTLYDPVTANFTVDTAAGLAPLAVQFTDSSTGTPTSWLWDFGDNINSTQQHPSHTYAAEGNYTVTLTASNPADEGTETRTEYIKVFDPVTAAFSVDKTLGLTPMNVQFNDTSTGTPTSWLWDFGDDNTSTQQNPSHTYTEPGLYTVTLTVADGFIGENPPLTTDTATQPGLIAAYDPLVPDFSATPQTGYIPLTVAFTDTSTGFPTTWHWDFGDGKTSPLQNPSHTYTAIGTYPVSLTVSHAADEQTETWAGYITADYQFTAAFTQNASYGMVPMTVAFTDTTAGDPLSWYWTFGDGNTSTAQNPTHVYTTPGYYDVSLTVYGIATQNTVTRPSAVHAGILPTVAFTGTPTTGTAPLTVAFTSTCSDTTSYHWDFGDDTTSTQQNPSHTYAAPGTYTVTLTGTNLYGSTVSTRADYVTATQVPPVAAFSASPLTGHAPVPVKFTDASTNAPTAWSWTFGDGTTSTLRNPTHIYRVAGTYSVTLTVTNDGGSDAETKTGYLTIYAAGDAGHTTRYPASDHVVTLAATGISTQEATLNGELAAATATEVWFEYGSKSNAYGFRTASATAEPGTLFSTDLAKFPLISGQTYYYRAACADGYGAEKSFTLTPLSPHPTTTYGTAADQFLYSFEDGDTMIQNMTEATWSPYVANLGALFFGLVIGAIFLNLSMKGHSIGIPVVLALVIGGSLWVFVPPEFVILAQAFVIMGIGGLVYYVYTKRKL